MNIKSKRFLAIMLVLAICLAIVPFSFSAAQDSVDLEAIALDMVAAENGVEAAQLELINQSKNTFELTQTTAHFFKVMDVVSGNEYGVTLSPDGQALDAEQVIGEERAANDALYGNLHPQLAELVAGSAPEASISVILWLYEPVPAEPAMFPEGREDDPEVMAAQEAVLASREAIVDQITAPVAQRLSGLGYATETNTTIPYVYTDLPAGGIDEVAAWPEVRMVFLDEINEPDLETAWNTSGMNQSFRQTRLTGRGAEVGVNEVGHGTNSWNQWLVPYTSDGLYDCTSAASHETGVLGIIFSSHNTRTGFAQGATVWAGGSCTGSSSQLQAQANTFNSWGGDVLNNSWGCGTCYLTFNSSDVFFDNYIFTTGTTAVKSAGNRGTTDGYVSSPGLGYNIITVGAFDDKNTNTWTDDSMASYSSYVDPTSNHGDREKPEVAAPGSNINSTLTSGGTGAIGSGTSYAAPMVSAMATLVNHGNYKYWPERQKAIMMAAATHNVDGASRLSDKDGAGAVYMWSAANIKDSRWSNGNAGTYSYTCATPDPVDIANISLVAGKKTRVAIAWAQSTSHAAYPLAPMADLDLQVRFGTTTVASSASFDNTYEIVEFTPATTGTYTIRVSRFGGCTISPGRLGWAFWRKP